MAKRITIYILLLAIGFSGGFLTSKIIERKRFENFAKHRPSDIVEYVLDMLKNEVDLNVDQLEKLRPQITETSKKMEKLHQNIGEEMAKLLKEDMNFLEQIITEDQKEKFQKFKEKAEHRAKFPPVPPSPGMRERR